MIFFLTVRGQGIIQEPNKKQTAQLAYIQMLSVACAGLLNRGDKCHTIIINKPHQILFFFKIIKQTILFYTIILYNIIFKLYMFILYYYFIIIIMYYITNSFIICNCIVTVLFIYCIHYYNNFLHCTYYIIWYMFICIIAFFYMTCIWETKKSICNLGHYESDWKQKRLCILWREKKQPYNQNVELFTDSNTYF